jgi:hypothetical protein
MRASAGAAGLLVIVLLAAAQHSDDEPAADVPQSGTHESAFTSASCDENNAAFNVEPDTTEAWADAAAWCTSSGEWLDNAPWPSGLRPVPLPIQVDGGP